MFDVIYNDFLAKQAAAASVLTGTSDLVSVFAIPGLVLNRYLVELRCTGLARNARGQIEERSPWAFGVMFPPNYLREAVHVSQLITFLGPELEPWHPNQRGPLVCLKVECGTELVPIIHSLFDLVTWRLFASHDPLNTDAAQWARNQPLNRFPVDPRPLKWRRSEPVPSIPSVNLKTTA